MADWTHAVCRKCWPMLDPDGKPTGNGPEIGVLEQCCWCRQLTASGIYRRHNPTVLPCAGIHQEQERMPVPPRMVLPYGWENWSPGDQQGYLRAVKAMENRDLIGQAPVDHVHPEEEIVLSAALFARGVDHSIPVGSGRHGMVVMRMDRPNAARLAAALIEDSRPPEPLPQIYPWQQHDPFTILGTVTLRDTGDGCAE